jgi:peptidoglycan hydrolase-like protein with peptidoglycan-binding domain
MARVLRIGDQGDDVRAVQDAMNFQIRRLAPLEVDGKFGPKTKARVIEFQRSNLLAQDGAVGHNTSAKLFETERMPLALSLAPTTTSNSFGIQPPRLIPPLSLPGLPPTLPVLSPINLFPSSSTRLPPLTQQGQTLAFMLKVPVRNDPIDPTTRSQQQVLQLLQTLPSNFPFRAAIIGAVPQPVKISGDIDNGFNWGIDPGFDLKKLGPPPEFGVSVTANARYTLQVVSSGPAGVKLGLFVGGDFKALLDYTSQRATSRPLLDLQGSATTGLVGVF